MKGNKIFERGVPTMWPNFQKNRWQSGGGFSKATRGRRALLVVRSGYWFRSTLTGMGPVNRKGRLGAYRNASNNFNTCPDCIDAWREGKT